MGPNVYLTYNSSIGKGIIIVLSVGICLPGYKTVFVTDSFIHFRTHILSKEHPCVIHPA